MTSTQKRLERLLARPTEMSAADVAAVLKDHGWTLERQESSHMTFVKEGKPTLNIPCKGGRKVKGFYIARVAELLMSQSENKV
jgi:predicted RNA binding protein YcfA (HicA-like mRNA interferase family)